MCVSGKIRDAPPRWHARRGNMCTVQISTEVFGDGEDGQTVPFSLSASLLTVNMKLLFSKHGSGKGNPRVFVFVRQGDTEQSEGWERCWEWRQITHHLIMLECATTLCIVSVSIGDSSCYCTKCSHTEGLTGGKMRATLSERRKITRIFGVFEICQIAD